ncbi:MAG TPA: 2-hydroxyacid dehydrogenase [Pararhizobium sp.]|uniref:2-hydroxyacid dehydrogenase n=1 Tax=Pararhizobium sp. TaxID=1977563 RepID=UPI002BC8A67E|nr:2-hydroxyacid dehydrogenase [Pararhizobium sp.]HTO33599.1 2-hydroxyacid dehydrogenase [Pararhizobium sp.]
MHKDITILQAAHLPEKTERELSNAFDILHFPRDHDEGARLLAQHGPKIRGIAVRHAHIDKAMLDAMPAVEIISSYSAGLDGIDVEAAQARGIAVYNTSKILAEDVADLAVALAISVTRGTVRGHAFVRDGNWENGGTFPLGRSLRSLKTGIVGLGHIGSAVAKRLQAMGVTVSYQGPRKKPVDLAYFATALDLAQWADLLIVTCPATPETIGLIDQQVLDMLGPDGFLVNISRGTIVNEAALVATLARDGIAGAGLDVFEKEPHVPEALRKDSRIVLSPHMGSGTRETRQQMGDRLVEALLEHFSER